MICDYRDLRVWVAAMDLAQAVYVTTAAFPRGERFGLTAQIRRAAVSVPSKIAEGEARDSDPEFLRFLAIAAGLRIPGQGERHSWANVKTIPG